MDNITHSLIGAALGQAGLKRKSGLAMPALIIAANIPDIDAGCVVFGTESLAMRRGLTHGPIALALLPLLLAGGLWAFDRWQAKRGKRPESRLPINFAWLLALCYIGAFTHPLFDWFNNYGIRLLEPFSHRWFYGDALFIIDLWILIALGTGLWRSRQREKAGAANWAVPARFALAAMAIYVAGNFAISRAAEASARALDPQIDVAVANAVPIAFWHRDVLWRSNDGYYGSIPCNVTQCQRYPRVIRKTGWPDPRVADWARNDPAAQAWLFWTRMPVVEPAPKGILLKDQRFADSPARNNFTYRLYPPS